MMNKIFHLSFFFFLLFSYFFSLPSFSQQPATSDTTEYFQQNFIRYTDYTYKDNIKTVLLYREGYELSNAMIEMNTEDKLKLSFDDLDPVLKQYGYVVIHCDADWTPSDLLPSEYIKGLPEDYINDYKFSRAVKRKYLHYNVSFPNSNFTFSKSGNYLLKVFENGDKDNIVLTKRFMVNENKVTVRADIHRATTVDDRMYKQEVDFDITYDAYQITNPYTDMKVVLMQNHRWDNAITNLKPTFVKDNELLYDYGEENVFPGGNEFRHFDIKNFNFRTDRVDSIVFFTEGNHVYLVPDEKMTYKGYIGMPDINGKRLIKMDGNWDSEVDADYTYVHFYLRCPESITSGNVYILGALSDWNFKNECKMKYNPDKLRFEATLYLKQGYYNYQYVLVEDEKKAGDAAYFEGSHAQTENDYTILIYHRLYGDSYDRLIDAETFNSVR